MASTLNIQDKHGSISLNPVHVRNSRLCAGSSGHGFQLKEMGPSEDEHMFKVRKPYTITKQREKWTEEEHNKFMEALKLYGRAWRRIEEHVGTKTAVQIRSHAQKFFSKLVRDSAGNTTGNVSAIEIPPPRPKRKPARPYPRKLGSISNKGSSAIQQNERSSPPCVSDQENGSPTSVLSGIGSSFSHFPVNGTSPISSASGSSPVGMLTNEKEIEEQSQSTSSEESTRYLFQGSTTREQDSRPEDDIPFNNSSVGASPPKLKLFGQDVILTDMQRPFPSTVGHTLPCRITESNKNMDMNVNKSGQEDCSKATGQGAWGLWPPTVDPQMFYCLNTSGNLVGSVEPQILPLPWWAFYGGLQVPYMQNIIRTQSQSCTGEEDREHQEEGSGTASNTISADKSSDAVDSSNSDLSIKLSKNSAVGSQKADSEKPIKGFVPYKRCTTVREAQHSQVASEEADDWRIRLCL